MRLAWFTPLPPERSGIARYAEELLPALARRHAVDVYTSEPRPETGPDGMDTFGAHDFVWRHAERPYDLVVYQLGNATCHDYMWAYLARYPGLVVLHDGQLHHSRARALIARARADRFRAEFAFDHPDAPPDARELGAEGLLGGLVYLWPMLRLPVESARLVAVHNAWLADRLRRDYPDAAVEPIRMGVGDPLAGASGPGEARARGRERLGLAPGDVAFGAFGGVTPEKRVPEILRALAAIGDAVPAARLVLVGAEAGHYDVRRDAVESGISDRVTLAGYVDDAALDDCLAAVDVCICLRWPSGYETSASWLRCLAAGKPTVVTDLPHVADVPALMNLRTWTPPPRGTGNEVDAAPVTVAIDILDEDRSLADTLRRLGTDAGLRRRLGERARAWWRAHHRIDLMAEDYERLLAMATARPAPALPGELLPDNSEHARELLAPFDVHLQDVFGSAATAAGARGAVLTVTEGGGTLGGR